MNLLSRALLAGAAAVMVGFAAMQTAEAGVKVGLLKCRIDAGSGFIVGSTKTLDCVFRSELHPRRDRYLGELTKIGADIGFTEGGDLVWAVYAPGDVSRGSLAGLYLGASGEATLGVGAGANVLIGGFENSVSLQPLSFHAQRGWNVAGGLASLRLVSQ